MRRAVFILAIGLIALWTGYCFLDLVYVALGYWSLAPSLGLLPLFSEPVVEPGFWGDYLKRLVTSWGSMVTGAGVIALLVREPMASAKPAKEVAVETYPIIPEAERTEPRLLFIEEPRPPRYVPPQEPEGRPEQKISDANLARRQEREPTQQPRREAEPRNEELEGGEKARSQPVRTTPIFRALRGRTAAASQVRRVKPGEETREAEEPPLLSGGIREEYGFFEVEYEDGTVNVERLRRSEYGGEDVAGIRLLRHRLAERAVAERRPIKPIAAIKPVSYFGFPKH